MSTYTQNMKTLNQTKFDEWWNAGSTLKDNPYREDSAAFWAWEGWNAGQRANEDRRKVVQIENEQLKAKLAASGVECRRQLNELRREYEQRK